MQGSTPKFYATFVDRYGAEAVISGTPTATVMHMQGSNVVYDISDQDMTQVSGTLYFYEYNIPARADKSTYTVEFNTIYSGINTESTHVVGGIDFQVIPRRFYDKKGGGFVQKVVAKPVWTEKEKDELIEAVEALFEKTSKLKGIDANMGFLSDKLSRISLSLSQKAEQKDSEGIKELIEDVSKELAEQQIRIGEYKAVISELGEKELKFDDSHIIKRLTDLSNSFAGLDQNLRNDRVTLVISEIEDLHKDVKELQEVFVKSMPKEAVERMKNEYERTSDS